MCDGNRPPPRVLFVEGYKRIPDFYPVSSTSVFYVGFVLRCLQPWTDTGAKRVDISRIIVHVTKGSLACPCPCFYALSVNCSKGSSTRKRNRPTYTTCQHDARGAPYWRHAVYNIPS